MREVNGVLWVSLILIAWGIGRGIYDVANGGTFFQVPDGGTLLLLGLLFGSVGQALFRLQARLIYLESRKPKPDQPS